MVVFELFLNGECVSTAGAEDLSVLSQTMSAVGKLGAESRGTQQIRDGFEIQLNLGGLTSRSSEPSNIHLDWYNGQIGVGDEITVRISEGDKADKSLTPEPEAIERARVRNRELEKRRFEDAKAFYLANKDRYESPSKG